MRCVQPFWPGKTGAAPATVSGKYLFHFKSLKASIFGKTEQAPRPASQETCLKQNVHGRGVRKVA